MLQFNIWVFSIVMDVYFSVNDYMNILNLYNVCYDSRYL